MQKINALQEQVASLKASADKAESECTSVQSQLKVLTDEQRTEIRNITAAAKKAETQMAVKHQQEMLQVRKAHEDRVAALCAELTAVRQDMTETMQFLNQNL